MPVFRGEPPVLHPAFPEGSRAAVMAEAKGPIPIGAERISYTREDDEAIERFIRGTGKL